MKILLVIASSGFQQVEYNTPKQMLNQHNYTVVTASDKATATAKDGSSATVDILLDQVHVADYAGIFFIGGSGALDALDNQTSYHILQQASQRQILHGAICISVRIAAKAGILKGKKVTGWNDDNLLPDILKTAGAIYTKNQVECDGNIITAQGPNAAHAFGQAIVAALS